MSLDAKKLMKGFAVEVVMQVIREFLNSMLDDATPESTYEAIQNDTAIWENLSDKAKKRGTKMTSKYGKYFKRFYQEINLELVLKWLKEDRPELYSTIINTPGGPEWLHRNLESVKKNLLINIQR